MKPVTWSKTFEIPTYVSVIGSWQTYANFVEHGKKGISCVHQALYSELKKHNSSRILNFFYRTSTNDAESSRIPNQPANPKQLVHFCYDVDRSEIESMSFCAVS